MGSGINELHYDLDSRLYDHHATFMVYLTDVEAGGYTAFPRLDTAVVPRKGDAVLWNNLNESGIGDELSLHGGCPVLRGKKAIANLWIRLKGQPGVCSARRDALA